MASLAHKPRSLIPKLRVALRGGALLSSPRFNKGTAFTPAERATLDLRGRLPFRPSSLEQQCARAYEQLCSRDTPMRKNTFLASLKDQNWVLYYALISRHLKELVPVIYTPTQGDAIANYSHIFRKPDGLFLTLPNEATMEADYLEETRGRDIDLVVVTDSEAILGIGDQGVGGIGISTAKAAMYSLIGGLDPARSLCVVLDVGTDNPERLADPLYVGWPNPRVRGEQYDRFVDKFVNIVRKHHPHSLLHFEDFGVDNGYRLLQRYKDKHSAFNDDIQGTGAVTLACLMAAAGVSSQSSHRFLAQAAARPLSTPGAGSAASAPEPQSKKLSDQRIVILGPGSAGMGIAVQVRDAMVAADGVSREEANRRFWLVDRDGLLHLNGAEHTPAHSGPVWNRAKDEFVRPRGEGWGAHATGGKVSLLDVVREVKPTVLIGCSTAAGAFTEEIVRAMADGLVHGEKPIIMPLSNPSRLVEAHPADILKWTDGRALVATGSPFGSITLPVDGKDKTFKIAECNNALIYPGLGFGAILARSRCMSDTMLIAGARRLARLSPAIKAVSPELAHTPIHPATSYTSGLAPGEDTPEYAGEALLPDFGEAPRVNFEIAVAVAQQAVVEGSARVELMDADARAGWARERSTWGEAGAKGAVMDMIHDEVRLMAQKKLWVPVYQQYEYDKDGLSA